MADKESLVDQVYREIIGIVNTRGVLECEEINLVGLAQRFGVSRTPVRTAIARMESEGLIWRDEGKGWVVASHSRQDVEAILDLEVALQSLAVRLAAQRFGPEHRPALAEILEAMQQAAEHRDLESWFESDARFHDFVNGLAGNPFLERALSQNGALWYRYRPLYIQVTGDQMQVLFVQHRAVSECIAAGAADRAVEDIVEHLEYIRKSIMTVIEQVLEPLRGPSLRARAGRERYTVIQRSIGSR